jgi:hypothetical protein
MLRQLHMHGRSEPKSNPKYRKCVAYRKDKCIACARVVLLLMGVFGIGLGAILLAPQSSAAAEPQAAAPFITIGMDEAKDAGKTAVVLQIFLLMTILSLAPAILIMLTSNAGASESSAHRAGIISNIFYHDTGMAQYKPKCIAALFRRRNRSEAGISKCG